MPNTATRFTMISLLITAFASGAAQAQGALGITERATATAAAVPASQPGAKLAHADADFLRQVAQRGHADIEGHTLALSKSKLPKVRAYAQTMLDEHPWAGKDLSTLAVSKGVILPNTPSLAQKGDLRLLSMREGLSFDLHYTDSLGVKAHQDVVKLFQQASDDAKDPDVKAFATKSLPILQHHLAMSRDLYATVHLADHKKP